MKNMLKLSGQRLPGEHTFLRRPASCVLTASAVSAAFFKVQHCRCIPRRLPALRRFLHNKSASSFRGRPWKKHVGVAGTVTVTVLLFFTSCMHEI